MVWKRGSPSAELMILGEGPGEQEDLKGLPFVGRSGELLDKALRAAGLKEEDVYITNVVKCRPPGNRNPTRLEMDACLPHLIEQVVNVKPRVVVTLGKVASEYWLGRPVKITKENGEVETAVDGTKVIIAYHPAYVLRNQKPEIKQGFFQAIQNARRIAYGIPNDRIHEGSSR
jgi:uracil-DNA glycosylase family 4